VEKIDTPQEIERGNGSLMDGFSLISGLQLGNLKACTSTLIGMSENTATVSRFSKGKGQDLNL
jgi:hypothetical protein